jgi:hypothetical protein
MHCTNWHELGRIDTSEKPHGTTCLSGPGQDSSNLYIFCLPVVYSRTEGNMQLLGYYGS